MPTLLNSLGTETKTKLDLKLDASNPSFSGSMLGEYLELTEALTLSSSSPSIINSNGALAIGSQGIDVTGSSTFQNDVYFSSTATISDTLTANGNIDMQGGVLTGTVATDVDMAVGGNLTVTGDLTVNGDTFEANSTYTTEDPITEKNKGADGSSNNVKDIGFVGIRGSAEQNIFLGFDEGVDAIVAKYLDEDGTITDISGGTNVANLNWHIPSTSLIIDGTNALGTLQDFIDGLNGV